MAVYFDHRAQAPYTGQNRDIQWHKTYPILAVGSQSDTGIGLCNLYQEEGEHVADALIKKSRPPSALAWHPTKKILAIGWETGELTIWNDQDHEMYEVQPIHKTELTILQWTSNGSKLLSGDAQGQVALWRADSRGRLQQQPMVEQGLGEQLNQVVLKPPPPSDPANDIASLARAAVSGDENALDMFNWQKGKSNPLNSRMSSSLLGPQEAVCFYIGGQNGSVYYLNESGKIVQMFTADGPVRKLLFYDEKQILITVTKSMMLTQHTVSPDGDLRESLKVKLSGKPDHADMIWAGKGILATCTGESVIRMWDIDKEENFILNLEANSGYERMENINCIAFNANKGILAAGTSVGHVAMFTFRPQTGRAGRNQEPEDKWKLLPPSTVPGPISDIAFGGNKNLLAVNTIDEVFILSEHVMSAHCHSQTAVVQTGPMALSIDIFSSGLHQELKADIQIKGVYTTKDNIAVFDNKKVVIYEITGDGSLIRAAGTFICESPLVCVYEQNVYTIEPGKIQVRTFQGTVKQLLPCTESEGDPISMNICGQYLVAGTSNGFIKLYDLGRREAKLSGTKNIGEILPDYGNIVSVKCNCNGTKISAILNQPSGKPNSKLYIWDVEMDTVTFFNFATGRGEQDEYMELGTQNEQDLSSDEKGKNQAAKDIAGRYPISHFWDPNEPKLCVCQAKVSPEAQQQRMEEQQKKAEQQNMISLTKPVIEEMVENMIISLFVTHESGIVIQDNFAMSQNVDCLLDLEVPFYYFVKKAESGSGSSESELPLFSDSFQNTSVGDGITKSMVARRVMRDFVGLENAEKAAKDAMMQFSYYLTIGNMDEAFKAIKLIKSGSVWENMAKMCVKTRRLDVAKVCLGNMGHARGAKALREAIGKYPELDARVAVLAMQLGLQEDAERLLKNSKRYDLLNEMYQASGQWSKSMETAELYDRIHLRTTYYNYGKHLESKGDINGAIPNYEKSDTHRFEVPRMLFDEPQALEAYIMKNKDRTLRKWWAQYMESTGEMETALQFYEAGQDYLSLVRVYCYMGNMDKAAEICNDTGDKAACYHLGRQYENTEQVKEAIHFFTRAGAYGNAIRLCRDSGNEDQMMNLALLGKPEDMVEAAKYYEFQPKHQDKAVMLYHKAGYFSKALDLAFNSKQFAALQMISEDLDESTDPELVARTADFFIENNQHDRAVDLLAVAGKFWDALKICMEQHVEMTEDLVEKLTPKKEVSESDAEERNKILEGIAEVCMQQRAYHLATKKYTQAGNKVKAMKALLKSGDTEKIVFFAGVSRQKEIYVMAANYLQSLDWRKEPEIMKNIIGFYTKGRALDSLSSFYDACAQVEIDEYQNYDKALGALGEAYKCLTKAKDSHSQEERLAELKHRIGLIKKFVQARRTYDEDAEESVKQCQVLLEESNINQAIRVGDIYGFLVEHFGKKEKWKAAWNCMEEMKSRIPKVDMTYYVNIKTLEAIHRALDIPMKNIGTINGFQLGGTGEEEEGEVIDEDVVEYD